MDNIIYEILTKRASRTELDTTKYYDKVNNTTKEYVGKFVRAYTMGSGDGMTVHWEFNNNGKIIKVDDELWGSLSGNKLIGFRPCNKSE